MRKIMCITLLFVFLIPWSIDAGSIIPGEKLKYEISVNGIRLGIVDLEVKGNSSDFFEIVGASDFIESIFLPDLNYSFGTIVTKKGGLPRQFYYEKDGSLSSVLFNQEKGEAGYSDTVVKIPIGTYDLISVFYHLRSISEKDFEIVSIHFKRKNLSTKPKAKKSGEIETVLGKVKTIKVNSGRIPFYNSHFEIWLTDNNRRIPLKITGRINYVLSFSFEAKLIGFEIPTKNP